MSGLQSEISRHQDCSVRALVRDSGAWAEELAAPTRDGQGPCIIPTTEVVQGLQSDFAFLWAGPAMCCRAEVSKRPLALIALNRIPTL